APNAPGAGNVERLNSQGLLGDRSNVANAISDYFNRQTQDNLADTRARLTATGGMSSGTPAAFAQALTNIRGGEALANALAQSDLGYREHDRAAINDLNNALIGNRQVDANIFGTQGSIYGNQLDFLRGNNQLALTGLGQVGNILSNIMGSEFNQQQLSEQELARLQNGELATNQLNLNSA